jgi:hypothetical protein
MNMVITGAVIGLVVAAIGQVLMRSLRRSAEATAAGAGVAGAVTREGPANFKDGWVMVGGVLKLTPDALVFAAHGFAQRAQARTWDLRRFERVVPSRTLGLIPNAITVTIGGADVKLVVGQRDRWMRDIQHAAEALIPPRAAP